MPAFTECPTFDELLKSGHLYILTESLELRLLTS